MEKNQHYLKDRHLHAEFHLFQRCLFSGSIRIVYLNKEVVICDPRNRETPGPFG